MAIYVFQMFYKCMLKVDCSGSVNQIYQLKPFKKVVFTGVTDTFTPSVSNSFSDVMKEKFSEKDLVCLGKKSPEVRSNAEILAKTKLSGENIIENLLYNSTAKIDANKIAEKVNEVEKLMDKNFSSVQLNVNRYDNKVFDIVATDKKKNKKTVSLDENYKTRSIQDTIYETVKGKTYEVKKSKDFQKNITSEVKSEIVRGKNVPVSEIIVAENYKEYSEPSDIKGIFNTKRVYNDGKIEQLSSGFIDKESGLKTIKKHFESLDGTKTNYEFTEDKQGNRKIDYTITDKTGNTLYSNKESFKVIDENTFFSTKNDKSYEIKFLDDNKQLKVKDIQSSEEKELNLYSYVLGNSDKLMPVLKKLSGDELIKMSENVTRLFQTDVDDDSRYFYHPGRKDITTKDNEYILLHELGHSKDMKHYDVSTFKTKDETANTLISVKQEVIDTYNKEKELFNKCFANAQREHIDYFLNSLGHSSGLNGAVKESLAEINALINTYNSVENYSLRSEYLQRYFPKTVACLAKFL